MKGFHAKAYPEKEELCQLAKSLNTSQKVIENWFATMRVKNEAERISFKSKQCSLLY